MKYNAGIFITISVFIIQLFLLPKAGLTWDEPSSFFFGRANLIFWMTGDRTYLTDLRNGERFTQSPFPYIYGEDVYPPFPFVISSAFSYVLSEKLGIMSVIDAHHLGEIAIGSVGVWAMYGILTISGIQPIVASGVTLLYAFYPTIFGQMRADAKDIPLMSMVVIFVYAMLRLLDSMKKRSFGLHVTWAIFAGVSLGLAVGTKPTAPIILLPLTLWFLISILFFRSFRKSIGKFSRLIPLVGLVGLVGLGIFLLSWPWLWDNPVGKLQDIWKFFRIVGYGLPVQYFGYTYQAGVNVPLVYPIVILLIQTPIALTVLAFMGIYIAVRSFIFKKNPYGMLFVLWFLLGIGRFFVPGVIIYAKVRHFIDAMPAFFVLVAIGLSAFAKKKTLLMGIISVLIIHEIAISIQLFPYEPSYFNFLVGGVKNVARNNLFDAEHWGSSVAEGMEWIKKQPGQKTVYACSLKHLAYFYRDKNITIHDAPTTGDFVLVPNSYSWFGGPKNVYGTAGKPVYTVTRAGADLLYIFKITSATWWCGYETDATYPR